MNGGQKNQERNTVVIKNLTCNYTCEEYIRTNLLGLVSRTIFLNLIQSISLFCELSLFSL